MNQQPCRYGHVECARTPGGPCSDERLSEAEAKQAADAGPICPRCGRVAKGWPLRRADVCSPKSWAYCLRNL